MGAETGSVDDAACAGRGKADLIQVGLIAVAQAALGFVREGDHDSDDAREAFLRYTRMRVKGAMIDEMRHMDVITREQRRKINVVQIARERWRAANVSSRDWRSSEAFAR